MIFKTVFNRMSPMFANKENAINLKFYDWLYYPSTFSLKFNDKKSMICLTPKLNQKNSEIIGV